MGLRCGNQGLRFLTARVLVREGGRITHDETLPVASAEGLFAKFPTDVQDQLVRQQMALAAPRAPMGLPGTERRLAFTRPLVMGILNVTPDSFSDGGKFLDHKAAIAHARAMVAMGADIIDIGGESTRPGATPVWEGEEAARVVPVVEALRADGVPLSIDTRHSFVMDKALQAGAHLINDVSALSYDPESLKVMAACDAPVVLMHARGDAADQPDYDHVLLDVYDYLAERVAACEAAGIGRERLILDPGIGFGKRVVKDNVALMNGLSLFHTLGCPLLLGASRKRFIGAIANVEAADGRMAGSLAAALHGVRQGVQIFRVHDVAETVQAVRLQQAFQDAAIMDAMPQNS
ncbi:MAG: dihydropteroate synthase [Alphaproteobacteria bacterium]|nr:MAG: dihydropteroate synthase [Alphaproteobacteria bacterium]